jgi:lipopolysaccharide/colanic/teichoic acid biosynthesis glycosyltransferase
MSVARKPDSFLGIVGEILALIATVVAVVLLVSTVWQKLLILTAITIAAASIRLYRRQERLRGLVEFMPATQASLSPVQLGAKPSPIASRRFHGQRPPYIPRPPFEERLDEELRAHRSVIVRGVTNSGKSHAIFEALGRVLPRHRVVVPKEPDGGSDPLAELLSSGSPLPRGRRYVLVVNDLETRLSAIAPLAIPRWLKTHRGSRLIATVSAERWGDLIREDASSINRATARLLSERASLTLSPDFRDGALDEARDRYELPLGKTKLGEFLAEGETTVNRLDIAARDNPAGRALALSAINCARVGLARPIRLSQLLAMSRKVTHRDGLSFSNDEWEEAIPFCISSPSEISDLLLSSESGDDPTVTANPAAVEHADRHSSSASKPVDLPLHIWEAILEIIADGPEDLLSIARAAAWRGQPSLAEDLLRQISAQAEPGPPSRIAAELLRHVHTSSEEGPVDGMLRRVSIGPPHPPAKKWDRELSQPADGSPFDPTMPRHNRWRNFYSQRIQRDLLRFVVLLLLDVTAVLAGIRLAGGLETLALSNSNQGHFTLAAAGVAASLVFIFFLFFGLYRSDGVRARLGEIIKGVGLVALSLSAIALAEGYSVTNLPLALFAAVAAIALAYFFRLLYDLISRQWVGHAELQSRVLLIDSNQPGAMASLLLESSKRPMQMLGYLAPYESESGWLGTIDDLESIARAKAADRIIISDKDLSAEQRRSMIYRAHTIDLATDLVPSPAELIQGATDSLDEMLVPLISVRPLYLTYVDSFTKRLIDVTLALLVGVIVAAPLLLIALVLKIRTREPVFVRKLRPGLSELYFGMLRLRTTEGDVSTRLGKLLERWRIDELPQLLNVLSGTMSIVGPRPIGDETFGEFDQFQRARYVVRPGITGLWQISRREHSLEEMTNLDLTYCRKWTPLLDFTILLRTVPAIVRAGARS